MKRPEGTDVRSYCADSDKCDIVLTGVHLLEFYSCKHCKRECSLSLKERVDKKSESKDDTDLESLYNGWIF